MSEPYRSQSSVARITPMPMQPVKSEPSESIGLVDETVSIAASKIKAFGVASGPSQDRNWARQAVKNGTGAVRVKTFHGKLSAQGMDFMDNTINEWLDQHPEVEVKFVTSNVGTFEGKMREPALIVNLWY